VLARSRIFGTIVTIDGTRRFGDVNGGRKLEAEGKFVG
jgi:hypothetical protein